MKRAMTLALISVISTPAHAQIADPEQRMRWFNLQRLAIEVRELNNCQFLELSATRFWAAHLKAANELGDAVENYIIRYPAGKHADETAGGYRYRVWSVAIGEGLEKARSDKQLSKSTCGLLTSGR